MVGTALHIAKTVFGYLGDRGKQSAERSAAIMKDLHNSWKDEYVTVVFTIPLLTIWLGACTGQTWLIENMRTGIEVVDTLPKWYVYSMLAICGAAAGVTLRHKW